MCCIYCRRPSKGTKGLAHIFPEAVWPKGPTLPRGAVCDKCNGYVGQKLETVLVRHPKIGMMLQLAGIPGKAGAPRKKLGIYERDVAGEPDAEIAFPIEPPEIYYGPDGVQRQRFTAAVDPHFDLALFSRALHHIALNWIAHRDGVDAALGSRYDAVRDYVRRPVSRAVRWPYVEECVQFSVLDNQCAVFATEARGDDIEAIWVKLYNVSFAVDLLGSGLLLTYRTSRPDLSRLIGPGYVQPQPKPLPMTEDGKVVHHRLSILKHPPVDPERP